MKTLHLPIFIILMAFLVAAVSFLPQDAHAMSITVHTDKPLYSYGDIYTISGKVNPVIPNQVVSIVILSTNYPHPASLSATPNSDGNYSYTLPLTIKDVSSGNFTVIVQYGIAKNQTTFSYNGPPCGKQNNFWDDGHSAPASNPRVVDVFGNAITGQVKVGQQIQITSPLVNGQNCVQPFAYLVQIQDLNGITFSLSWITGTLLADQFLNPAQSWTPTTAGVYTVQIFTWQSLDNPNALAPVLTTTINVEDDANLTQSSHTMSEISPKLVSGPTTIILDSPLKQFKSGIKAQDVKCNTGFILVLKQDYAPACIKEPSAIKLFLQGWIFGFADYQPVYFMKHNIHAEISVKYSPFNHGSMSSDLLDLYPRAYSKTNSNYPTDAIYANANPDMISQNAETIVKYTIMAQNNTRGVYWLSLDNMCELVQIAVDVDKSNLTISDLQSPATAWKCPGSTMQYHIIGVSGVTVGLVPIRN